MRLWHRLSQSAVVGCLIFAVVVSFAYAAGDQVRKRVLEPAVLLRFKVRSEFPETGRASRLGLAYDPIRGADGKLNMVRCSGTFLKHGNRTFILTAAHCLEYSKIVRTSTGPDGRTVRTEEYDDAEFVYELKRENRKVGEVVGYAKVLVVGGLEEDGKDDLALLETRDPDAGRGMAAFIPPGMDYDMGDDCWNASSLYGEFVNSLLRGTIANRGHLYEGRLFDIAVINIRPGSSGSGLHVMIGETPYLAGVVTRGDSGGICMYVPIQRIRSWLHSVGYSRLAGEEPAKGEADHLGN